MSKKRKNTETQVPPSGTQVPPSGTQVPPSGTAVPPSGTAVPPSGTAVPPSGTAVPGAENPAGAGRQVAFDDSKVTEFEINGVKFSKISVISGNSGEAKVYLVENKGRKYALKVYNAHRHPNHDVLERLKGLRGNGLTVDVFEHGVMDFPWGASHDYELMRWYSGRNLSKVSLKGNDSLMRKTAQRMAMAIDFCHRNGILHRDIKPANFMYTDDKEKEFVLTDFGIAKLLDDRKRATTDAGRTPVYAAPEMYTYYFDRPTYVSTPSDFFAMGMTLLAMWKGEGNLIANEEQLVKDKQEETLPYPDEGQIDARNLQLLKALTRRNADIRAGFAEIVKWSKGETIYEDPAVDRLKGDFRVVFSRDKNLIAHSTKELAKMMQDNPDLAKDYLYSDMVKDWLKENDMPELSRTVGKYTEDTYAADRDAGLFATCLLLDGDIPYVSPLTGNVLHDEFEIAREIFEHAGMYAQPLKNTDSQLWIFMRHIGVKIDFDYFVSAVPKRGESPLYEMAYRIDPELPFRFPLRLGSGNLLIKDCEHLRSLLEKEQIPLDKMKVFASPEFQEWLSGRNMAAIDALYDTDYPLEDDAFGWLIAYMACGNVDYAFRKVEKRGDSDWFTIEDIAMKLAREICANPIDWENDSSIRESAFLSQFNTSERVSHAAGDGSFGIKEIFPLSRVRQYLLSKGKYEKQIAWMKDTLNYRSDVNSRKYGRYNRTIARMKTVAGILGHCPLFFSYKENERALPVKYRLNNLKDFEIQADKVRCLCAKDSRFCALVQDWLAVQFQEDPRVDYNKTPYLQKTREYLEYLRLNLPDSSTAVRAEQTDKEISKAKSSFTRSKGVTMLFYICTILFGFVPLLLAGGYMAYMLATMNPADMQSALESIGKWGGIVLGVIVALLCFEQLGPIWSIGLGFGAYALVAWVFGLITPAVPWILIALTVAGIIYAGIQIFKTPPPTSRVVDHYGGMNLDDACTYAVVGDAFKKRKKLLPDLPDDYPARVYRESATGAMSGRVSMLIKTLVVLVVAVLVGIGAHVMNRNRGRDAERKVRQTEVAGIYNGTFEGTFDNRPATMQLESKLEDDKVKIDGVMTIHYKKPLVHKITGMALDENPGAVFRVVKDNGAVDTDIRYEMVPNKDDPDVFTGDYSNAHKGSEYKFELKKSK